MPRQTGRGGGVGLYIQNTFDFSTKVCPTFNITFKYILIEIKIRDHKFVCVICMYRLQELSAVTFVCELDYFLSLMNIYKKLFFLVGDINLDLLQLNQHAPTYDLYNVIIAHNLSPAITRPTRVTDSSATLIDNIKL